MCTAEYRVQKHILCYNYNSIRHCSYYQFIDMQASHQNPPEHLAFLFCQSSIPYMVLYTQGCPFSLQHLVATVSPLCSTWLLVILYNVSLASGVLLMQESSVSIIARFLHVGKTFTNKFSRIYRYRNTVPPWLTSHHGCEKQDKWTVGKKKKYM